MRGSRYYGPYGGAGHVAAYNPATGMYSRAGYAYGPRGPAGYRTAYNPATDIAAGRAGGVTPYGSWGRSAVTNGDEWIRASHTSTARGAVGAIQGSEGGAAITTRGRYCNGATVARGKSGDYYAAKDGNVYKRNDDGWEQTRNSPSGSRSASPNATGAPTPDRNARPAPRPTEQDLKKQAKSRGRGERNTARAQQAKRGGGGRGRGSGGRRAAPSRGGGRRGQGKAPLLSSG